MKNFCRCIPGSPYSLHIADVPFLMLLCLEQELKKHGVTAVVRVCDPSYKVDELKNEGIDVFDLPYNDGAPPPNEIVDEWFKILKRQFHENPDACVAVHCIAGLGRAPSLVALALVELGLKYEEAVELIRE